MNETSLNRSKLVSRQWGWASGALGQGAQAARADVQPDGPLSLADRHGLHVRVPTAPGMALRKTHVVAEHRLPLATEVTAMGHLYPLTVADRMPSLLSESDCRVTDYSVSGRFVQTANPKGEVG